MSRPTAKLTNEQALRLHDMEWEVPSFAVDGVAKRKGENGKKVEYDVKRWNEVANLANFYIDQKDDGTIKGQIRVVITDQDLHQPTNPNKSLTIWLTIQPDLLSLDKDDLPQSAADERWSMYWQSKISVQNIESLLIALGETGILVGRKYLTDFGALYDLLETTDLTGRELMVNLQYPPSYEKSTDPDVRYFSGV